MVRPTLLTTPEVTVWSRPQGLPMAMAIWPTRTASESAMRAAGRSRPVHPDHGDVAVLVGADHGAVQAGAVGQAHGDLVAAGHHVGGGEDVAVGPVDEPRSPGRRWSRSAPPTGDSAAATSATGSSVVPMVPPVAADRGGHHGCGCAEPSSPAQRPRKKAPTATATIRTPTAIQRPGSGRTGRPRGRPAAPQREPAAGRRGGCRGWPVRNRRRRRLQSPRGRSRRSCASPEFIAPMVRASRFGICKAALRSPCDRPAVSRTRPRPARRPRRRLRRRGRRALRPRWPGPSPRR